MLMPDLDLGQDLGCGEPRVHIHALGLSLVLRERSSSMSVISHSISPRSNQSAALFVCLFVLFVYLFRTAIRCLVSPFPYLSFLLN